MIFAAITAAALCQSAQLTATLGSTGRGAGQVYDTIVVRNVSSSACAVGPAPAVMLVDRNQRDGQEQAAGRVTSPPISLKPGATASFVIHWTPMGPGGGECARQQRDVWLYPGGGGLPLWVPLGASTCYPVEIRPFQAGSGSTGEPPERPQYDDWASAAPCRDAFLRTENRQYSARPDAPATRDALKLPVPYLPVSTIATRPDVMVPSIWTDVRHAIMTSQSEDFGQYDTFACSRIVSIPPGGGRGNLTKIKTAKGVRLGMTAQQVERIEGTGRLRTTSPQTQTLFYRWTSGSGDAARTRTMSFAFWKNSLFGIHYQDAPSRRYP